MSFPQCDDGIIQSLFIELLFSSHHWKSKRVSKKKKINFCFIDYAKAFDCVDHNKLWKILKEMGIPDTWPTSREICMQVKKQQLELDMEQQTGSKLGKESRLCIVTQLI